MYLTTSVDGWILIHASTDVIAYRISFPTDIIACPISFPTDVIAYHSSFPTDVIAYRISFPTDVIAYRISFRASYPIYILLIMQYMWHGTKLNTAVCRILIFPYMRMLHFHLFFSM